VARARTEPPVEEQQEVRAQAKWLRITPRKARLVVDHIRGRTVPEARSVLAFTPRAAAREIEKVLASAVANAEANHNLLGDELVISAAYVDEGPTIKRWRPRARGRIARVKKRTCHVTLKLQPVEAEVETPSPAPEAPKRTRRRRASEAAGAETPQAKPSRQKPKASSAKQEAEES
jgi:large subunit ribosomal protein L22